MMTSQCGLETEVLRHSFQVGMLSAGPHNAVTTARYLVFEVCRASERP